MELFKGLAKLLVLTGILSYAPQLLTLSKTTVALIAGLISTVVIFLGTPYIIFKARAYRLSRTLWQGQTFRLEPGAIHEFAKLFYYETFLSILTVGFYRPIAANRIYSFLWNHTRYGSRYFTYQEHNQEAWQLGIKSFFLTLLTLGIYSSWYRAALIRFRLKNTSFESLQFQSDIQGSDLFQFGFLRFASSLFTLGLANAWIDVSYHQTLAHSVITYGEVDWKDPYPRVENQTQSFDEVSGTFDIGLEL